jgi:hypothetical protein
MRERNAATATERKYTHVCFTLEDEVCLCRCNLREDSGAILEADTLGELSCATCVRPSCHLRASLAEVQVQMRT